MGKRVGVRTEYFKRSQAKGVMSHNKREFEEDKNVIDKSRTKHNYGTKLGVIDAKYEAALSEMNEHTNNVLLDSVLVLPEEQIRAMSREHPKDWKKKLGDAINSIMAEIENEQGFVPLGYRVHLDEGHVDKDGKVKLNTHAHMMFANHCRKDVVIEKTKRVTQKDENGKAKRDPDNKNKYLYERDEYGQIKTVTEQINLKGRSPLSLMQTRGSDSAWSKQQDIAAKHLAKYGFERGLSKEITNRKHKKKSEWVKRELKKNEQKLESVMLAQQAAQERLRAIESDFEEKLDEFIEAREKYFTELLEDDLDIDLTMEEQEKVVETFENLPEEVKPKAVKQTKTRLDDISDSFKNTDSLNNAQALVDRLAENKQKHDAKNNGDKIEAKKDDKIKI